MKNWSRFASYGAAALIVFVFLGLAFRREPFLLSGVYGDGGGDAAWFLGQFASIAQVGPFATNLHLNWPLGSNTWSYPQPGLFLSISAWTASRVANVSALGAYQLAFSAAVFVNTLASLFFFRSISRSRYRQLAVVLSVAIGMSPFALLKVVHVNVATFFLIPIALAVVLRWPAAVTRRDRVTLMTVLFVAGAFAPLWWGAVVLLMVIASVPWMLALGSVHSRGLWWRILLPTGLGVAVPTVLGIFFAVPGSAKTRFEWDSNRFGGHLVDLLTASPFLNAKVPLLTLLKEGGSLEPSMVGIVGGMLAILTVAMSVTLVGRRRLVLRTRMLLGLSIVSLLLFLLGGLGNLQAAVGVIAGEASPSRAWSRIVIVLALLGGAWVMHWLSSRPPLLTQTNARFRRAGYEALLLSVMSLWALDWTVSVPSMTSATPANQTPEAAAVDFLQTNLAPCPVAQLPLDSSPNEVLWIKEFGEVGYRGYVPFILAPEFFWSYGGDASADTVVPTASVGPEVTDDTLDYLHDNGYCALLFDRRMSALAVANDATLPGLLLSTTTTPEFHDDRYSLYILNHEFRQ